MIGRQTVKYACAFALVLIMVAFILLACFAMVMVAHGQTPKRLYDSLDNGSYLIVYDPALKIPVAADWVCSADFLGKSQREPSWRFTEDSRVARPRATHDDYTRSGYDRGHLCPAADRSASAQMMKSTFIMTNVCPQVPRLNRGDWKRLETSCRAIANHGRPLAIHVDAVFWRADTERIGRNAVAVPHGFVKTVRDFFTDTICYSKYFQNW